MTTLSTAELAEQLDTAALAEEECRAALERLQAQTAGAGLEPSADERKAEAALSAAMTATARIQAALEASQGRDRANERAAAAKAAEQQDLQIVASLANVEKASAKLAAAAEAYVSAYDLLVRAVGTAQGFIAECPRLDGDTRLPSPHLVTSEELGRLGKQGAQPPGSAFHSASFPDLSRVEPITARYASFTRYFRAKLGRELAA